MPFMVGSHPIRYTYKYLKNFHIILRENVRIFVIAYNRKAQHHKGAFEFMFWHFNQMQYHNPTVQCVKLENVCATPFIKFYLEDHEPVLVDCDSRTLGEIYNHIKTLGIVTKTHEEIKRDQSKLINHNYPPLFGYGCNRHCICEIQGQVPCSSVIPVPRAWRGIKKNVLNVPPHIMQMVNKQSFDSKKEN